MSFRADARLQNRESIRLLDREAATIHHSAPITPCSLLVCLCILIVMILMVTLVFGVPTGLFFYHRYG